jgi:hypothetical protein
MIGASDTSRLSSDAAGKAAPERNRYAPFASLRRADRLQDVQRGPGCELLGEALGRAVDLKHAGSRGNYRMLQTPPDEPIVQIQRVDHESRVHIDIESDDIPAEVARLEKLGAKVVDRLERWTVMQAPTGQRFCVVRVQRPGFPKNANRWD